MWRINLNWIYFTYSNIIIYLLTTALHAAQTVDKDIFSENQLNKLQHLFRFANLHNSRIGDILYENNENDVFFLDTINVESSLLKYFLHQNTHVSISTSNKRSMTSQYKHKFTLDKQGNQVGGYEGCKRDYGALAEPLTNGVITRVARKVLTLFYADVDSWSEFCTKSCDFLCGLPFEIIPPPVACNPGCSSFCRLYPVSENSTRESIIEGLLDRFIPKIAAQEWGRKMIDAMAKIPTGISDGQLMWTGAWDLCNDFTDIHNNYSWSFLRGNVTEQRIFNAKACRMPFQPPVLKNRSISLYGYFAVCVPDTCSSHDIATYLYEDNILFRILLGEILEFDLLVEDIYCGKDNDISTDPAMQACIAIIGILAILVISSAIYDAFIRPGLIERKLKHVASMAAKNTGDNNIQLYSIATLHHSASTSSTRELIEDVTLSSDSWLAQKPSVYDRMEVWFVGFSAYSNIKRIFTTDRPENYIPCLDFIRFFSFGWILFGHTWLFGPVVNELWETANLRSALLYYPRQFIFQPVANYHYAGDTFLLLRIVPALMIALMIYTVTYKYVIGGPLTPTEVTDANNCRHLWWKNLLLIHNLDVTLKTTCLSWTWFLGCLYQLHLMAPCILVPLVLRPRFGYIVLGIIYSIHIIVTAVVSSHAYDTENLRDRADVWFTDYLIKPWCRAGPYLIGILLGTLLQSKILHRNISKVVKLFCWLVCIAFLMMPAYGTYSRTKEGADAFSKAEQVAYDTLGRSTWALGVSWVIIVVATNNAGYFGDWLNHPMYQPLARMVYPSYLMEPMLVFFQVFSLRLVLYISWSKMIQMALSNLCISLFFGVMFTGLLIHYPIAIGWQRPFTIHTKFDCIKAAMHYPEIISKLGIRQ